MEEPSLALLLAVPETTTVHAVTQPARDIVLITDDAPGLSGCKL